MDRNKLLQFPEKPGVYLMKNAAGQVLYIGKAKALQTRLKQYFIPGRDNRAMIPILVDQIDTIETILTFNEKEALLLENRLIKEYQPKYNVLLKDDKTFISLMLNHKHKWPMLKLVRHKEGSQKEEGLYFGPYTSALSAKSTFDLISRMFPLRECSDRELVSRSRPCILFSMKRCLAPCVRKCTTDQYQEVVSQVRRFLGGQNAEVIRDLKEKMHIASTNLEFETAGALLRTIKQIEEITHKKTDSLQIKAKDSDVFNYIKEDNFILIVKLLFRDHHLIGSEHFDFSLVGESIEELLPTFLLQHYSKGNTPKEILLPHPFPDSPFVGEILETKCTCEAKEEQKPLLQLALENAKVLFKQLKMIPFSEEEILLKLQSTLSLNRLPVRIECFDTSNLAGQDAVASLVSCTNGVMDRARYRTYKLAKTAFTDDYGALTEILTRRLSKAKEEDDLPDLLIVDGGKGQLSIALKVVEGLNIISIDLISIAKEEARHDKGLTQERIFLPNKQDPIILDLHSPLLFFLQKIRDEAHRKAITFHRKKRSSRTIKSLLDDLPGIGPVKKKNLMKQFGSIARIIDASEEELLKTPGITKKDLAAHKILKKD